METDEFGTVLFCFFDQFERGRIKGSIPARVSDTGSKISGSIPWWRSHPGSILRLEGAMFQTAIPSFILSLEAVCRGILSLMRIAA